MKKIVLLCVLCLCTAMSAHAESFRSVNCDYNWALQDALMIKQYDTYYLSPVSACSELEPAGQLYLGACDLDGDGACGILDAMLIQQCDAQIVNEYCDMMANQDVYLDYITMADSAEFTQLPPTGKFDGVNIKQYASAPEMILDESMIYETIIKTTVGDMKIRLFSDVSPLTVNNWVTLALDGYYDGVSFHRVIENFMVQGGDPTGTGRGNPGYSFADETDTFLQFDRRGLLAMANSGADTNGSQFFVTHKPTTWLTGNHTIFGILIEGDDAFSTIPVTGEGDTVLIESVEIYVK